MRVIRVFDILLQYVFIFLFAGSLVAGVFDSRFFFLSGGALVCYFVWGLLRLKCPWCKSGIELSALLRGLRRGCNCPSCGHEITVVWHVTRGTPRKLARQRRDAAQGQRDEEGAGGREEAKV